MKVGVLGGGQLGRMLALAGYPLGLRFRFLDPAPESPVEELADLVVGRFDDLDALTRFPVGLDVITYEFENVPVESKALHGVDSLLSIVQMPAGIPVATLAIGRAGAINAALLATAILAGKHPAFGEALASFREKQTRAVLDHPDPREAP